MIQVKSCLRGTPAELQLNVSALSPGPIIMFMTGACTSRVIVGQPTCAIVWGQLICGWPLRLSLASWHTCEEDGRLPISRSIHAVAAETKEAGRNRTLFNTHVCGKGTRCEALRGVRRLRFFTLFDHVFVKRTWREMHNSSPCTLQTSGSTAGACRESEGK